MNLASISLVFGFFFNPIAETIQVPLDHGDPQSRKITVTYHYENEFDPRRETVFTVDDPIDYALQGFDLSESIKAEFNWVRISGRHFSKDLEKFIHENANQDWEKIYRWLNQNQVSQDIELIRKKILCERKVMLIGYSSSTGILLHYLSTYSQSVDKLICINPFLMDIQTNLSFWNFSNNFQNQPTVLTDAEFFGFAYRSSVDYFNSDPSLRDSLIDSSMKDFKENHSNSMEIKFPTSFAVRAFEHTIELMADGNSDFPVANFLKEKSEPFWTTYLEKRFPLIGTNYDVGLSFGGQVIILGSAYDLLINPKVVDVLAEFFPRSTLVLFRDGHSLEKTKKAEEFSVLLLAFLKDDFQMKVNAYQSLTELNLLFLGKDYNNIRVD
ncbi:alpha/beta fold hydrolase [Algoriphagus litoralis]|uniref:alpha/beta fold hydrolase n=1 Tax=Algoriphagus litoralis TaxID=2202829 RepID=UPI000DB90112|nr:alpha/beta fold hydrolase [Algoriphagus litoralis]